MYHEIESFAEIYEKGVEGLTLIDEFINDVVYNKNGIDSPPTWSETILGFYKDSI